MPVPVYERAIPALLEYEIRAAADGGNARFTGYAAVFGVDSEPLPFIESIQAGAFTRSLSIDNTHTFVIDHDDTKLLASRKAHTLTLSEDSRGLHVEAELPHTSYANDLVELHSRGEARSMSFTFRAVKGGENWTPDNKRRTLTELRLGHVSVLTGLPPAYRQTTASIRSLAHRLGTEADELSEAIESLREGRTLEAAQITLLTALIGELRTEPAATQIGTPSETSTGAPAYSLQQARARLALYSQAR